MNQMPSIIIIFNVIFTLVKVNLGAKISMIFVA